MENKSLISENSDFLFVYDATLSNPNGDPDQENKPRMDYDTDTNLVTDTRVKRSIRDYLKATGHEIFVDMEGEAKVSPDSKLKAVINRMLDTPQQVGQLFGENVLLKESFSKIIDEKKSTDTIFKTLQEKKNLEVNNFILAQLVKEKFIDIRLFGSAFAIGGFNRAITGPIQLNWGYSLHKVDLVESNSIVTTMNDDSSTFGKDYRVHYSLLAFNGTINKHTAKSTGLTVEDRNKFRKSIWDSISALPTRSKLNQYPKLYIELVYNDGVSNGHFGDLRQYIDRKPDENIRKLKDVHIDLSRLVSLINENRGKGKAIREVIATNQLTEDKF
jgi:CRISPR-associated protein Csh2